MSQQSKPSWPDETTTSNLSQKYPSTQLLRSSLSSTPHYGAGGGTNKESGVSLDHPYHHHHETTSGEEKTVDFAEAARQRQQLYTSKVDFCARDVIACINCDGDSDGGATMTTINSNRKQGPVLLELRRISVVQNDANKLFATRPICVSRSNPSLGTSLSSTCLQVAPSSISSLTDATLPPCATGLTTGALCIHAFTSHDDPTSSSSSSSSWTPTIEYFHTPRHHRPSTAVAWRPTTSQVAIGLVGSSSTGGASSSSQAHSSRRGPAAVGPGSGRASSSSSSAGGGDKDFCCFIWDVEHQVSTAAATTTAAAGRRTKSTPIYKLAHQTGVASLSWVLEGGQLLALGAQMRNLQLFDLRIKTTGPQQAPLSVYAHNFGVHGVETDPSRPWQLASFCRAANEPVKIWDARRMDTVVSEIKISGMESASSSSGGGDFQTASVSTVKWSALEPGRLAVAVGDAVYDYDLSSSRPTHVNTIYANEPMVDICLYPYNKLDSNMLSKATSDEAIISAFFPKRLVAVYNDRTVHDVARHTLAPVAISRRDGRVVHAFGRTLFVGSTSIGPSAMERLEIDPMEEDISATMMRRARCQHVARYSMDTTSNIKILAEDGILAEQSANKRSSPIRDALLRLWSWIERVESLCSDADELWGGDVGPGWPAKGLIDAGAKRLLQTFQMDREEQVYSESLACVTYESAGRR